MRDAGKLSYWVMGGLASLLLVIGSSLGASIERQLVSLELGNQQQGERIAALEAQQRSLDAQLVQINAKLDRLIDQRPSHPTREP